MIRGFFDDSSDGSIFLVAGWVTDYQTWERFSKNWRDALDENPKINYFRHHEAKSDPPSGQFEGWSPGQIEAKMRRLANVICKHEMYGVVSGLNIDAHMAAFDGSAASWKQLRSVIKPIHCFHSCAFSASALILQIQIDRGLIQQKVDLVFDETNGLLGECIEVYNRVKEFFPLDKKAIAGTLTEADDKDVEALQAADLLAGQLITGRRLGFTEEYYRSLWKAHTIYESRAYLPGLDQIPELIKLFNVAWSTRQLSRIVDKRDSRPRVDP
jgi:hypothetical protein